MLKSLVIVLLLLCCEHVFGNNLKFLEEHESEILNHQDLIVREPMISDLNELGIEVEKIYYRPVPQSRQLSPVIVEADDKIHPDGSSSDEDDSDENSTVSLHPDSGEDDDDDDDKSSFQPWSILWYVGSFGGLIAFFLVVSCSEWCCRNHAASRSALGNSPSSSPTPSEQHPPPEYDEFAPPSYDSLCAPGEKSSNEYHVYVVPVHNQTGLDDRCVDATAPPDYYTVAEGGFRGVENNSSGSTVAVNITDTRDESNKVRQ